MTADDNQMTADRLVAEYLRRLREAASALPADRREELIEEITAHVAEARAQGAVAGDDALAVRNILDRLGDPAEIVRTAADHTLDDSSASGDSHASGSSHAPGASSASWGNPASGTGPADVRRGPGPLEITAVVLLLVGGIVLPVIGWVAGVILLWISPRWSSRDKWIGTLVWPGGLLAPVVLLLIGGAALTTTSSETTCSGAGPAAGSADSHRVVLDAYQACVSTGTTATVPVWLGISLALILLAVAIAGPIYTAVRLLRRVQDAPAQPAAEPASLQPV